jgi:hypothetical protein
LIFGKRALHRGSLVPIQPARYATNGIAAGGGNFRSVRKKTALTLETASPYNPDEITRD